jgi:hypothetical protein
MGCVTDQGDQFPLTLHLQAKHTKAVLRVVEGDTFNEASEAVEFGGGDVSHGGAMVTMRSKRVIVCILPAGHAFIARSRSTTAIE